MAIFKYVYYDTLKKRNFMYLLKKIRQFAQKIRLSVSVMINGALYGTKVGLSTRVLYKNETLTSEK